MNSSKKGGAAVTKLNSNYLQDRKNRILKLGNVLYWRLGLKAVYCLRNRCQISTGNPSGAGAGSVVARKKNSAG